MAPGLHKLVETEAKVNQPFSRGTPPCVACGGNGQRPRPCTTWGNGTFHYLVPEWLACPVCEGRGVVPTTAGPHQIARIGTSPVFQEV